jgi:membrane glycosyltransferase
MSALPYTLRLRGRRLLMLALVASTIATVVVWLARLLAADGSLSPIDLLMLILFALTTPMVALGFWSALIGTLLLRFARDPIGMLVPAIRRVRPDAPIRSRIAIVMPVCDEVTDQVFRHLRAVTSDLDASGEAAQFEVFLLSDTRDPGILSDTRDPGVAAAEEAGFAAWRAADPAPARLHYRRRADNVGFKAGNIWDFCERSGDRFDLMIVLDADSVMSAAAIRRLVRTMEAAPEIGILQPLIVGLPSTSPFARIFQFGMRHGMRAYATGTAWWQADEGSYWGHNAIIRLAPFRAQCRLPVLPGRPPLGGHVLSHDQLEAVLMRAAGHEVRVLPIEDGSFEQNPPTLPDFLGRDLRWCQGNMQYLKLLCRSGIRPIGRLQLMLAVMMYLASPFWLGFLVLGLAQTVIGTGAGGGTVDPALALGLFGLMLGMSFAPKLLGVLEVLLSPECRRAWGGAGRITGSALLETLFSFVLGPVAAVAHTIFIGGLLFGRQVRWSVQRRDGRTVRWMEAWRGLWPQTLFGLAAALVLLLFAPAVLPWAAPVLAGLLLAVGFARLTSSRALGRRLARFGLCATPEEIEPPAAFAALDVPHAAPHPRAPALRAETQAP